MKRLVALHLAGNALLLLLGYFWLGVGEASAASLALSAGLLVVFVVGLAWLHGTSFAFFRDPALANPRAMLGRLLPLVVLTLAVAALYFALSAWNPLGADASTKTASYFTLKLQKPIRPASVQSVFSALWWVLLWAAIPTLLLPLASGVAANGWSGFREFGAKWKNWRFWLMTPALLVLAIWVPLKLVTWKPMMSNFGVEMASAIARFGLAYLLFVGTCLLLAFVTSRGKPVLSQPSTVPSP